MNNPVFHIVDILCMALNRMVVFSPLFFQHSGEDLPDTRDYCEVGTRPDEIGRMDSGGGRRGVGVVCHCPVDERRGETGSGVYTGTGVWLEVCDCFRIKE